ncbi:hypothetical protein KUTeg_010916 [Tegillarca granosa]|uniref:Uncharacterized protein n=1 Tax=Tegillarca granosa TaxID=220873 RepID=A0ABQ9F5T0_TEGGR|nr:hypothetical protein KUTeg_010916 [Tegillarca granosa]
MYFKSNTLYSRSKFQEATNGTWQKWLLKLYQNVNQLKALRVLHTGIIFVEIIYFFFVNSFRVHIIEHNLKLDI